MPVRRPAPAPAAPRRPARRSPWRALVVLLAVLALVWSAAPSGAAGVRVPVSGLQLSARGASFIGAWEGFRATVYDDPAGHCTIGFGHLVHLGRCTSADRARWGTISRERGLALLRSDAGTAAAGLRSRLAGTRLSQTEFDALVSFVYNIGLGGFDSSSVKRDLLARPPRYDLVPGHLRLWVYSGGQVLCGLHRRRISEGRLFSTGSYALSTAPCPPSAAVPPAGAPAEAAPAGPR